MPLEGKTVLAVDDNVAHSYALKKTLESLSATVLTAYSGTETLSLALEIPDIILLDINLPDLNGYEVCRRLKADERTTSIPVVFITAECKNVSAADLANSVGARSLLFYPVDKQQLLAVVQGQLARVTPRVEKGQ